jgi:RNA polymerase sigma-70 factor, ECF subfamily
MANYNEEFSQIYDQCIDKIYRFIFVKVNSKEIAQDLCSETFLKGLEAYKKNSKIDNPSAFLYRIARNSVIDYYRQKDKNQFISPEFVSIADPNPGIEEKAALNSDLEQVKTVLADLKEDYQNVIIWRYLDELTVPEISEIMNKSEDAVRVTLHRALRSLKGRMEDRDVREV